METTKVKFTDEEKSSLSNLIALTAHMDSRCYEVNGFELEFDNIFNPTIQLSAKVLINDYFSNKKPSRYSSNTIKLFNEEGNVVESNLDAEFEDSINKALINEFNKNN